MPTPAKTSREALVAIALKLVDANGAEALTIAAVAEAAGVRGPSIYKHFADRAALLLAVSVAVIEQLAAVMAPETTGRSPRQRLFSMGVAYRRFALKSPHLYQMIYRPDFSGDPAIGEASRLSVQPLFDELAAAGVPPKRLLSLARVLVAFLHGFVSMEASLAFRLGGDVDKAFEEGFKTLLDTI
jgi:AcrR family transcriptional regulator